MDPAEMSTAWNKRAVTTFVESAGQLCSELISEKVRARSRYERDHCSGGETDIGFTRHRMRLTFGSLGKSHGICTLPADHCIRAPHGCPTTVSSLSSIIA